MSDRNQPFDPSGSHLSEAEAGTPTSPHGAEVEGYMLIFCHYCSHSHKQSDPKCNIYCPHGSSVNSGGLTGGTGSTY